MTQFPRQDLLGGLMMAAPNGVLRFASQDAEVLRPAVTLEQMWTRMRDEHVAGPESARDGPGTCLGREEDTDEWRTLQKVGITLREVRRVMSGEPDLVSSEDATGQFPAD